MTDYNMNTIADRLSRNCLNMRIYEFEFDKYSEEDVKNIHKQCEAILNELNYKVHNFDDSLEATYDFMNFVDAITDDPLMYKIFYGDGFIKWAVLGLCSVLNNRKLFTIYYLSRGLGTQIIWSKLCVRSICKELKQREKLYYIRQLLNTSLVVECIKEDYEHFRIICDDQPELTQYIDEVKTRAINEGYKGESSVEWNEASNAWFGTNPNPLKNTQLYYI